MKNIKNSTPTSQRKPTTKQQPQNHQIPIFRYIHNVMQERDITEQSSAIGQQHCQSTTPQH